VKSIQESEGEDLIADFLEEKGYQFKRYERINNLKGDSKDYREADFYLTDYKIYLEFLGDWEKPYRKKEYKEKMSVYHKNKIPCAYLWPGNLGNLDWIIKRRIRETLLKYDKKLMLLKFEWGDSGEDLASIIIAGFLCYYFFTELSYFLGIITILFILYTLFDKIRIRLKKLNKLKKTKWVRGKK
jgi:hypothetical protein